MAFCKQKARARPVRPDWEMAEDALSAKGERVLKVSVFGKSMTGYVEVGPGQWLADHVWCLEGRWP